MGPRDAPAIIVHSTVLSRTHRSAASSGAGRRDTRGLDAGDEGWPGDQRRDDRAIALTRTAEEAPRASATLRARLPTLLAARVPGAEAINNAVAAFAEARLAGAKRAPARAFEVEQ
jgi:hypothetical protein